MALISSLDIERFNNKQKTISIGNGCCLPGVRACRILQSWVWSTLPVRVRRKIFRHPRLRLDVLTQAAQGIKGITASDILCQWGVPDTTSHTPNPVLHQQIGQTPEDIQVRFLSSSSLLNYLATAASCSTSNSKQWSIHNSTSISVHGWFFCGSLKTGQFNAPNNRWGITPGRRWTTE